MHTLKLWEEAGKMFILYRELCRVKIWLCTTTVKLQPVLQATVQALKPLWTWFRILKERKKLLFCCSIWPWWMCCSVSTPPKPSVHCMLRRLQYWALLWQMRGGVTVFSSCLVPACLSARLLCMQACTGCPMFTPPIYISLSVSPCVSFS